MMKSYYSKRALQNVSELEHEVIPTVKISEGEAGWKSAYELWLNGDSPTDSPEWERGAYLIFEPTEYLGSFQAPKSKPIPTWVKVGAVAVTTIVALALLLVRLAC